MEESQIVVTNLVESQTSRLSWLIMLKTFFRENLRTVSDKCGMSLKWTLSQKSMSENFLYLISYSLTLLLTLFKFNNFSSEITLQSHTCRFTNHDFFTFYRSFKNKERAGCCVKFNWFGHSWLLQNLIRFRWSNWSVHNLRIDNNQLPWLYARRALERLAPPFHSVGPRPNSATPIQSALAPFGVNSSKTINTTTPRVNK